MNNDLISRKALKDKLTEIINVDDITKIEWYCVQVFSKLIDNAPTVEPCSNCKDRQDAEYIRHGSSWEELQALRKFKADNERPKGEWEYEHELSCGRILKLRLNVVEHKCNKCKHWSIRWAGTIPDNFCSHCGADMRGEDNG